MVQRGKGADEPWCWNGGLGREASTYVLRAIFKDALDKEALQRKRRAKVTIASCGLRC